MYRKQKLVRIRRQREKSKVSWAAESGGCEVLLVFLAESHKVSLEH